MHSSAGTLYTTNRELEEKLLLAAKPYRSRLEKKKKWQKVKVAAILCCLCFCCCVVLPLLLISNVALFMVLECSSPMFDQVERQTFAASDISSLSIDLFEGNIVVAADPLPTQDSFTLEIRRRSLNFGFISPMNCDINLSNYSLSVSARPNWFYLLACPFTHVSMFVPHSAPHQTVFDTLHAHTKIGSINMTGLVASNVDIVSNIGDVEISSFKGEFSSFSTSAHDGSVRLSDVELLPTSSDFIVSSLHGSISASNIISHSPNTTVRLSTTNGDCTIDGFEGGSVAASLFTGNFKLHTTDTIAGSFELSALFGTVQINGSHIAYDEKTEHSQKGTINGGGQQLLQADTKKGDVSVELVPAVLRT